LVLSSVALGKKTEMSHQSLHHPAVPRRKAGQRVRVTLYRSVTTVVIAGGLLLSGSVPAVSAPALSAPALSATILSGTPPLAGAQAAAGDCTKKRPTTIKRNRIAKRVHRLINEQRTQNGLAALQTDPGVKSAAVKHSQNMADTGIFSHVIDGKGPVDRLKDENVEFTLAGENIYSSWCQTTNGKPAYDVDEFAYEAVAKWMDSDGHRKNILNPDFTHTGIGIAAIARDGKGYLYATQVFIKR
jgi:uncharacterized protein YkwD